MSGEASVGAASKKSRPRRSRRPRRRPRGGRRTTPTRSARPVHSSSQQSGMKRRRSRAAPTTIPRLHRSASAASRLHLGRLSAASRLHLGFASERTGGEWRGPSLSRTPSLPSSSCPQPRPGVKRRCVRPHGVPSRPLRAPCAASGPSCSPTRPASPRLPSPAAGATAARRLRPPRRVSASPPPSRSTAERRRRPSPACR